MSKVNKTRVSPDVTSGNTIGFASFYKPSTLYMSGGFSVDNSVLKAFFRYSQDVWGPFDYQAQLGWTYHRIYQMGLSYIFLRDAEAGFRYTGTRMTNEFLGSDMAAFNEYSFLLSYHFTLDHDFTAKLQNVGRPLPQNFPAKFH